MAVVESAADFEIVADAVMAVNLEFAEKSSVVASFLASWDLVSSLSSVFVVEVDFDSYFQSHVGVVVVVEVENAFRVVADVVVSFEASSDFEVIESVLASIEVESCQVFALNFDLTESLMGQLLDENCWELQMA